MAGPTDASPLAIPHILLQTLSYASPQTLGRCMAVSSYWYDAAATFLWAHVSYRVNPYLRDPGVTPFFPVPPGEQTRGLRRAKRRAVRHVRVLEMRKHSCEEVGCERMTLHEEESEEGALVLEGLGLEEAAPFSIDSAAALHTNGNTPRALQQRPVLTSLRLHIEDKHTHMPLSDRPRLIPYPCPLVSKLDAATIVLAPLRQLSNARPLPLPSPPSLRKLVLLIIPPTSAPGEFRLADTVPDSVEEVVIYLWRRHASSAYDNFRGTWATQMGQRQWGPDKVWGHWCNFILAASLLGLEIPSDQLAGRRPRRYTFVGTGAFDPLWLDLADKTRPAPTFPSQDPGADPALHEPTQKRVEEGMRACMRAKIKERRMRYAGETPGNWEEWEAQVKECLDSMRFLSREEYLAEGKWHGDFTREEVMYHG